MKNFKKNNEDGFTLIEILVTICIIGILAAVAVPYYLNSKQSSYDSAVVIEATALKMKVDEHRGFNRNIAPSSIAETGYFTTANDITLSYKTDNTNYCIFASHDSSKKYTTATPYTTYNGTEGTCPL